MRRWKHFAAALRATFAMLITFGVLGWTDAQVGAVLLALELWGMALLAPNRRR